MVTSLLERGSEEAAMWVVKQNAQFLNILYKIYQKVKKEIYFLGGCRKTSICCVALILRHCLAALGQASVLHSTPHSSGFRAPCI